MSFDSPPVSSAFLITIEYSTSTPAYSQADSACSDLILLPPLSKRRGSSVGSSKTALLFVHPPSRSPAVVRPRSFLPPAVALEVWAQHLEAQLESPRPSEESGGRVGGGGCCAQEAEGGHMWTPDTILGAQHGQLNRRGHVHQCTPMYTISNAVI